jgi:O-antigen/teichoic acid export membrane protein
LAVSVGEKFRRLGADTIWYGLTSALSRSVALVLLPIYARLLTPSEFGVFDLAMVAVTVISLIMGLELHGALKRYYFEGDDDRRATLVSSLYAAVIVIGVTAAIVMISAFMALREMGFLEAGIASTLFVAVGAALFKAILALSEVQLRMERRVGRFAVIQSINLLVSGSASLFFLIIMGWGVVGILLGYTLGSASAAAVATRWVADRLRPTFDWSLFKRALSYAAPLVPSVASGYLRRFGDRIVILAFLPFAGLGVYALGYRIAMIPMLLITAFQMSWSPLAMSLLDDPDQEEVYCRALRYYTLLVGGFGMVIAALAPEIVRILGTETYASAVPLVGWIVGAVILHGAGTFVTVGAMVAERTSIHLTGSLVGGLSALAAMTGLVPLFGLIGAAVGGFAGALLGRVVTYTLSQRAYRLRYDGTRIAAIIALFVAMQAVLLPLSDMLGTGSALLNRVGILVVCLGITGSVLLDSRDRRRLRMMLSWS